MLDAFAPFKWEALFARWPEILSAFGTTVLISFFALILALAVLLGQGTAAWLAAAAAGLSALEELVLVLRAWTPAPDVRGLLWIEKPRR